MPEEQAIIGDHWHKGINSFLTKIFNWKQLGDSNVDAHCDNPDEVVGLDSVFSYKRNKDCASQVVFVEAKSYKTMNSLSAKVIEDWTKRFIDKIESAPHSYDFHQKFQPDNDSEYRKGLLALLIRENSKFDYSKLSGYLSSLHIPQRKNSIDIFVISNNILLNFCAIHSILGELKTRDEYDSINYFIPSYGNQPVSDGESLTIECLLSKFVFCKARKKQVIRGAERSSTYESSIVFYTGKIQSYDDFRFIGLAIKNFNLQAEEIEIYTLHNILELRIIIANFKAEFAEFFGSEFIFRQINLFQQIPGWLSEK